VGSNTVDNQSTLSFYFPTVTGAIQSARRKKMAEELNMADTCCDQQWQDFMWGIDVMRETVDKQAELSAAVIRESERT
jgi:salicylate hydroxylase